jgi:hypothetical protein
VTTAGGNIFVTSDNGSVNSANSTGGYTYSGSSSPVLDPLSLGGISTATGGNVTINAKQDVISYSPGGIQLNSESGIGTFGGGNLLINAGHNVLGHFLVVNGNGTIVTTGGDAGNNNSPLSLSLASGSWHVNASGNIVLLEVRNPNGIFNNKIATSPFFHLFDYADTDSVSLTANYVELVNSGLPRNSGETKLPAIYAPSLSIFAGTGGIKLDGPMVLFPSAKGSLDIETIGGGSLVSGTSSPISLTMSDSGSKKLGSGAFSDAFMDHASYPVHLNNETLCKLDISGDMNNISLNVPEPATVKVGGSMVNSAFTGQNLKDTDVTSFNVTGNIFNANEYSTQKLSVSSTPQFDLLLNAADGNSYLNFFSSLTYNSATSELTVRGRFTQEDLKALFSLKTQAFGSSGQPLVDINGNPVLTTVHILDGANAALVSQMNALLAASQTVPTSKAAGYIIAGPGKLNINAASVDLGDTFGIQSVGPLSNPSLALHDYTSNDPKEVGASINMNLTGDLTMFSSQISTIAGGDININVGGKVTAGSTLVPGTDTSPRGIYTVAKGDISLIAGKDINLDGSRLAAFDGGNLYIKSSTGNVNAGTGGASGAQINEVILTPIIDPLTGLTKIDPLDPLGLIKQFTVHQYNPIIPGSGIIATTFPPAPQSANFPESSTQVGNIKIETPQGDIIASEGGVKQLSFNGQTLGNASISLEAGSPGHIGNIVASGTGIIGANVKLKATGNIDGFVIAQGNLDVNSVQNVTVTAIATGTATVNASGSVSGTVIGVGGISASGGSIEASLVSASGISASGGNGSSGSQSTGSANVAGATSAAAANDDHGKTAAVGNETASADDERKRKNLPALTKTGRVTVILPGKS